MKPVDLRAAGLSDDPADWDGVNAEPRPESAPDSDPIAGPEPSSLGLDFTKKPDDDPAMRRIVGALGPLCAPGSVEPPLGPGDGFDQDGRIVDMRGMESAGRRVREALEQQDLIREAAAREVAALMAKVKDAQQREEAALQPFKTRAAYYGQRMEVFARLNPGEVLKGMSAKAKSRLLACGLRVKYGTEGGYYRMDQQMKPAEAKAALVKWALECSHIPDLVREEPVANVDAVKGYLATLECIDQRRPAPPPGMEWVEESQSLSIVVEEKKR